MAKSSFERNISKIQNVVYCTALFSTICLLVFKLVRKKISLNINFQLLIFTLLISIFIILTGAFFYWQGDRYHISVYPIIIISLANFLQTEIINETRNCYSSI